jgi:hypothetical protein
MEYNLQKKKIAERIVNIINDIKGSYEKNEGKDAHSWDITLRTVFLINCDTEISCFLDELGIKAHEDVYDYGLAFGVLVIQSDIKSQYEEKYGEGLEMYIKDYMYAEISDGILDFIFEGMGE